jgi:acyl carrier protein
VPTIFDDSETIGRALAENDTINRRQRCNRTSLLPTSNMPRKEHAMSATPDTEKELIDIVRNDLAVDLPVIDGSSRLVADLGLDSVAFAVALVAIDERLGVRLSERELTECATVADVLQTIFRHTAGCVSNGQGT